MTACTTIFARNSAGFPKSEFVLSGTERRTKAHFGTEIRGKTVESSAKQNHHLFWLIRAARSLPDSFSREHELLA